MRRFRTPGAPIRRIPVYTGMRPVLSLHGLTFCKFVSRSYLVLISFWTLTMPWILYPISFCRRFSSFVALQTKVAHLCFCLVHIKMPLLIWQLLNGHWEMAQKQTRRGTRIVSYIFLPIFDHFTPFRSLSLVSALLGCLVRALFWHSWAATEGGA